MSTILFIFCCIVLLVILLDILPGTQHFVKPIISLFFYFFQMIVENGAAWAIWLFKSVWKAHIDLFINLVSTPEAVDPTLKVKDQ